MMKRFRASFAALALACATLWHGVAMAQAPSASGEDLTFTVDGGIAVSREVREAIMELLADRGRLGFRKIKACFVKYKYEAAAQAGCRQQVKLFFDRVWELRADLLGRLPPLEVYIRLVDLSGDPQRRSIAEAIEDLKGIINTADEAYGFVQVKLCYQDAALPAMRRLCGAQLDRFHAEYMRNQRDIEATLHPKTVRARMQAAAERPSPGEIAVGGGNTAFNALRQLREDQQRKLIEHRQELARAQRYYCPYRPSRRGASLESAMQSEGVCLCSYGRRYVGASQTRRSRPVLSGYRRCETAGRFRIADLNGGHLMHGDWVVLRAADGAVVTAGQSGFLYAASARITREAQFQILRASGAAGRIRPGEMVAIRTTAETYLSPAMRKDGMIGSGHKEPAVHDYVVLLP